MAVNVLTTMHGQNHIKFGIEIISKKILQALYFLKIDLATVTSDIRAL